MILFSFVKDIKKDVTMTYINSDNSDVIIIIMVYSQSSDLWSFIHPLYNVPSILI